MSSDEDKPPAPPVRLTSNRATDRGDSVASVDMRPLPKGMPSLATNYDVYELFNEWKTIVV